MERKKDELIIKKGDEIVDMYVVLDGKVKISAYPPHEVHRELQDRNEFDMISQINMFKVLKPGQIFGDFSCFLHEKGWKSIYAYPEDEKVQLLKIDASKTREALQKLEEVQKHQALLAFLDDSIPGFKFRTSKHKEKITSMFREKTFPAGHHLIKEAHQIKDEEKDRNEYAYILKEGEARIVSYQIPLIIGQKHKAKKTNRNIINQNGYFSKTTNSFQIGLISEKQWIGDELLIFKDDSFPFAVVTQSVVKVLVISKSDLLTKMPKDIQAQIEEKAGQKLNWIKKRLIDICLEIENVSKWDKIQENFNEKVSEIARQYPKATSSALYSFISQIPDSKLIKSQGALSKTPKTEDLTSLGFSSPLGQKLNITKNNNILDETSPQQLYYSSHKINQGLEQSRMSQGFNPRSSEGFNLNKKSSAISINIENNYQADTHRPKTAFVQSATNVSSDSYYGGFFNTQISFKRQIDIQKQQRIQSSKKQPSQPTQQDLLNKSDKPRPQTQEGGLSYVKDFSQSQNSARPVTAAAQLNFSGHNVSARRGGKIRNSQSMQSFQGMGKRQVSATSMYVSGAHYGMNQSKISQSTKNLVFVPTLKSLLQTPIHSKDPKKIPMEYASTFICSFKDRYCIPTFSRLQLAKKQSYETIFKSKQQQQNLKEPSPALLKINETVSRKHNQFIVNGKCINVQQRLKRQNTPNYVDKWASDNKVDLKQGGNPEVIKRKQIMMDKLLREQNEHFKLKSENHEKEAEPHLAVQKRMTVSLRRMTGAGPNAIFSSSRKLQ